MTWLLIVAALAVGYALGQARCAYRVAQWAAWQLVGPHPTGPRWWAGCIVRAVWQAGALMAHPGRWRDVRRRAVLARMGGPQ